MTVNLFESPLEMMTEGGMVKALFFLRLLVRVAIISGRRCLPDRTSSMSLPTLLPRRVSSSSIGNSRLIRIVSNARPSDVVKICASAMLAPAAAQAPVMIESRRGWSGASTVISVMAWKEWVRTMVDSAFSCLSASRMKRVWRT